MTNLYKQLSQLNNCYKTGKKLVETNYNYCNFQSHLDSNQNQTIQGLLDVMNKLEKDTLKQARKKEVIRKNGTLLSHLAFSLGMRSDNKKFKYIEMGNPELVKYEF